MYGIQPCSAKKKKEMGFRYTINISKDYTYMVRERERTWGMKETGRKKETPLDRASKSSTLRNSDYWVSALAMAVASERGFKSESGFSG